MELAAFASFGILIVAWLVAPSRPVAVTEAAEHEEAAAA